MTIIDTERLWLWPWSLSMMRSVGDRAKLSAMLGASLAEDWPNADYAQALPFIIEDLSTNPHKLGWDWLIVVKSSHTVVGGVGLKGGPDAALCAEVGYGIALSEVGKGFATEALNGLVHWSLYERRLRLLTAECEPMNGASIRVLQKAGFGSVSPADGLLKFEIRGVDACMARED